VTEADLLPFLNAQAPVYSKVIEELTAGCKRTHWMWFIFPQLRGLGHSAMAQRYAIRDLDQATRYLADPILGSRFRIIEHMLLLLRLDIGGKQPPQLSLPGDAPWKERAEHIF
jgi:uncharacterized protein (DUF1810 family)